MPTLNLTTREGVTRQVHGEAGSTVMEAIRAAGFDELLAICGGSCACATCHVHVDEAWLSKLPPMSEDENDLLESSSNRSATSRLSCQLPFTDAVDGLAVTIVADD